MGPSYSTVTTVSRRVTFDAAIKHSFGQLCTLPAQLPACRAPTAKSHAQGAVAYQIHVVVYDV